MAGLGAYSVDYNCHPNQTNTTDEAEDEDEDHYIPPHTSRPFGAGIKRKRVTFVPASSSTLSSIPDPQPPPAISNISAKYLSIVLPPTTARSSEPRPQPTETNEEPTSTCPVCAQPLNGTSPTAVAAHEASITHQLALEHSHPPSSLDRDRKGLRYLVGHGWDPDSRVGLGVRGKEGIRVPVKAVPKRDTAGLGLFSAVEADEDDRRDVRRRRETTEEQGDRKMLNAKQVRKVEEEKKKRADKLRTPFYSEDLSRYLGPGG